jgi:hypothetical protein
MTKKAWVLVLGVSLAAARTAGAQEAGTVFVTPLAALQASVKASNDKAALNIVSDRTTTVDADLNSKTVKCSAADYSGPMLKVLVPGLADLTVLNHRNTREGAPCVAAGRCGAIGPQDILKTGEGVERIKIRVVLRKETAIEGEVCHVSLIETVATTIRGVEFHHERVQEVAERAAADCK